MESFWASHQPPEVQIELFGTEACSKLKPLTLYRTDKNAHQDIDIDLPKNQDLWDRIAGHLLDCILDGKPCEAPLRHGYQVQRMMEGLLKTADLGKEVRLR